MKRRVTDERIIQESHKQNSFGFFLLYTGLLLILIYRQFGLQQSISEHWDLAILFFGVSIFLSVKRVLSGNYTSNIHHTINIVSTIIASVVFTVITYFAMDNMSTTKLIISGLLFFFGFFAITLLLQYLSKRKNDSMLKDD